MDGVENEGEDVREGVPRLEATRAAGEHSRDSPFSLYSAFLPLFIALSLPCSLPPSTVSHRSAPKLWFLPLPSPLIPPHAPLSHPTQPSSTPGLMAYYFISRITVVCV